jgi:hypothetical protein
VFAPVEKIKSIRLKPRILLYTGLLYSFSKPTFTPSKPKTAPDAPTETLDEKKKSDKERKLASIPETRYAK